MKWRNKRRLSAVQNLLWQASDLLENIRLDAQLYYATESAQWQEGPDGARYHRQMRSVYETMQALRGIQVPDVEALR